MKKWYILFVTAIFIISCNDSRPVKNCETYAEAPDPDTTYVDWSGVEGLQCSFGSIDERYVKRNIPTVTGTMEWTGTGWRGERLSAQAVLWSNKDIEQVECEFTPFKSSNGDVMEASIAQARFVRYVLTDEFGRGCGYRKPEDFPVSLSADALDNVECLPIKAKTTQPVWLTFDIPSGTTPGVYTGTMTVYAHGEKKKKMKITLDVLPQTLPPVQDWKFHLDVWPHPSAVARVHNVPHWSEEHWKLLEGPMRMLADVGVKVITATLNKDPWNNQSYDAYEDMIKWTKKQDGAWEYDYTIFDKWVNFMLDLGIDKQINCFSMIPWNSEIHYMDEKSGEIINVSLQPGSREFADTWTPFLLSFKEHLSTQGWLGFTNIAMDERPPKDMKATLELLAKIAPELGVTLQDNHKSYHEFPYLKDICISHRAVFAEEDLKFRKENGLISTFYVCCSHRFPNIFTFSDPAEATFIGWYTMAAGFDGFLHWSYNSWVEDPLRDSRFRTWPAGDTYMIYPGNRSSIRYERLREGIQDAEKIRILREKFQAEGNSEKLQLLETGLAIFNTRKKPDAPTAEVLNSGKLLLHELSK